MTAPDNDKASPASAAAMADVRQHAVHEWEQQTDASHLGRRFSGERVKRLVHNDWLGKAGFALGTLAVLGFVLTHDGKEAKRQRLEAKAAESVQEPSVRDYRPPVMPLRADPVPPAPAAAPPPPAKADDADAVARQRRAEQLDEARIKSDIFVRGSSGSGGTAPNTASAPSLLDPSSLPLPGLNALTALGNRGDTNVASEDSNRTFAKQMSGKAVPSVVPHRLGDLDCLALQGKLIDAQLETAINTDLPGQIRAIVSKPLYAEQGGDMLVTPGSRLIGVYNTAVNKGQVRVFAIWNRVIRPDGVEIAVDSGATDSLGQAGLLGDTDNHFAQIFGMSALLSIIGAGAGSAGVGSDSTYNSADAYRSAVQQSFARTSDRLLGPYANIPPTNTVAQGERVKVFLNRDLDFCTLQSAAQERRELVLP